jgi:hypothetical protein
MKKKLFKKLLLDEDSDEEICDIKWIKKKSIDETVDDESSVDINKLDDEPEEENTNELVNFDMSIIDDKNIKKVKISFELNISLNNKNKKICIDVVINKSTYLKIADELN